MKAISTSSPTRANNLNRLAIILWSSAVAVGMSAGLVAADAKAFRAGAARSDITPPLGQKIVGGFHPFPATHIHDELWAKCLVLDDGKTRLGIVVCDNLGMVRGVFDEAARWVEAETGLPRSHLMMSATHSHSAGSALGSDRYQLDAGLDDYQKFIARRIADGVRRAISNLRPAQIGWGRGEEPDQVFNRRWFMKPGTVPVNPFGSARDKVKMNPGRMNPNLVKPAGPTDPEIMLLAVRGKDGKMISLLANYSLHYVGGVPRGHVSADYYGIFCDRLADLLNADKQEPPFVAMLSNGTSGDINNINFMKRGERMPSYQQMNIVAADVAQAAAAALKSVKYRDSVTLGAAFRELQVGLRKPTPDRITRARALIAGIKNPERKSIEEIYAERTMSMAGLPKTLAAPIQAFRVGDVGIAAIPNEVLVEIGLELKRRSPFKASFTHSIANGYYGYLPTPEQHALGGYETWLGTCWFEESSSTKIVEALLQMWNGLK